MANLRISIFESFLSGGSVGRSFRRSVNATLKASTRTRSRVACAVRYFSVARRRPKRKLFIYLFLVILRLFSLLLSSRVNPLRSMLPPSAESNEAEFLLRGV